MLLKALASFAIGFAIINSDYVRGRYAKQPVKILPSKAVSAPIVYISIITLFTHY